MRTLELHGLLIATAITGLASCASSPSKARNDISEAITACSSAPHCVSSENAADSARRVEPFKYSGSREQAHAALRDALRSEDNAHIESDVIPVVRATFRSTLGFVDDVTFVFRDDAKLIDVKSTSRIGYYDFGVNKRRVERLREQFSSSVAKTGALSGNGLGQR